MHTILSRLHVGLFLLLLCNSTNLWAHLLNMSEITAEIDAVSGELKMQMQLDVLTEMGSEQAYYKFAQMDPAQAQDAYREFLQKLTQAIEVHQADRIYPMSLDDIQLPAEYDLSDFHNGFVWPKTGFVFSASLLNKEPLTIRFNSDFVFEEPIALQIKLVDGNGDLIKRKSRWLVAQQLSPAFPLDQNFTPAIEPLDLAQIPTFITSGYLHILPKGWDHLLFLLVVFLSARSYPQLWRNISLFAFAHCITLSLGSYRAIEIPAYWVEIMITLSIGLSALMPLVMHYNDHRKALNTKWMDWFGSISVSIFGLVHGLGFAWSIAELDQSARQFLVSLGSFAIGLELAQLSFILILIVTLGRYKKQNPETYTKKVAPGLCLLALMVSLSWLAYIL